ncbi:hypothetical protein ACMXYV_04395 [Neptuniibacter sp. SY11_33]|uniref:hypothetical protein n=1 Tax=Neptuniibacter sp. SY11_33 TaxID=3398215 RepID=UPI0039F4B74B
MMLARWHIDARFGHKQTVIDSLSRWFEEIGSQIGWTSGKVRIVTGSVGAKESVVISEVVISGLTELDESWQKLGDIEAHKTWSKELEPYIVSGSQYWEILRIV